MAERKSISKKLRFEVFKRDSFTCQYCGRMAPDVVLEIDHIKPVVDGGENDVLNLVTSCFDCNRGKGKRKLSDKDEIKKQQEQLKELNRKREQLEMLLEWRKELNNLTGMQVDSIEQAFYERTDKMFTEEGRSSVSKWIKEFGINEVFECLELSLDQYFVLNDSTTTIKAFNYIPRICNVRKRQRENPYLAKQNYIYATLKKRVGVFNDARVRDMLHCLVVDESQYNEIYHISAICKNWTEFWELINEAYEGGW